MRTITSPPRWNSTVFFWATTVKGLCCAGLLVLGDQLMLLQLGHRLLQLHHVLGGLPRIAGGLDLLLQTGNVLHVALQLLRRLAAVLLDVLQGPGFQLQLVVLQFQGETAAGQGHGKELAGVLAGRELIGIDLGGWRRGRCGFLFSLSLGRERAGCHHHHQTETENLPQHSPSNPGIKYQLFN